MQRLLRGMRGRIKMQPTLRLQLRHAQMNEQMDCQQEELHNCNVYIASIDLKRSQENTHEIWKPNVDQPNAPTKLPAPNQARPARLTPRKRGKGRGGVGRVSDTVSSSWRTDP